jgi:hypothetical protein
VPWISKIARTRRAAGGSAGVDVGAARLVGFVLAQHLPRDRGHLALPERQVPQEVDGRVALGPLEVDVRAPAGDVADVQQQGGQRCTYTTSTTMPVALSTANVWYGVRKKKLTSRSAHTAASSAGRTPPTTAAATTGTRYSSVTPASDSVSRSGRSTMVSAARPRNPTVTPSQRRRPGPRTDAALLIRSFHHLITGSPWPVVTTDEAIRDVDEPRGWHVNSSTVLCPRDGEKSRCGDLGFLWSP